MRNYFKFSELGTNYRHEIIGGLTTFVTMAYIVIVNPAILANGGFPKEASVTATIIAAVIGTFLMAIRNILDLIRMVRTGEVVPLTDR